MIGQPYTVGGRTYVPQPGRGYVREGSASWYGSAFHGRLTANGEIFDRASIAAAHPTLPLPSYVRVTNVANGRSMIVRVNDRGPYEQGRLIDVSERVALALEFHRRGTTRVRVEYVGKASLSGSDDEKLLATLRTGAEPEEQSPVRVARSEERDLIRRRSARREHARPATACPTMPNRCGNSPPVRGARWPRQASRSTCRRATARNSARCIDQIRRTGCVAGGRVCRAAPLLPLREKVALRSRVDEGCNTAFIEGRPSSDLAPQGHLLPQGEKEPRTPDRSWRRSPTHCPLKVQLHRHRHVVGGLLPAARVLVDVDADEAVGGLG